METFFVTKVSGVLHPQIVFIRTCNIGNQGKNTYKNRGAFYAIWHQKYHYGRGCKALQHL